MTDTVHVLGFAGSLRRGSFNRALLRAAQELLPDGMTLETYDLRPLPFYDGDLEAAGLPRAVQDFKARIAAADALLIATPEYNYSIPGVLKNALDWASRPSRESPLNGKPFAVMGVGGRFGTVRAQQHLRQISEHNGMLPVVKPQVLIARAWEQFDAEGRLVDESSRQAVRALLAALKAWTLRLNGSRAELQARPLVLPLAA